MNNTELEEKLFNDHRIRDIVGGVYASDAIPIHVKKRPLLHIVNTDPSYMPGKHWVVIYIGEDGLVEHFDPLGEAPNSTIEHYLWSISPKGYLKITTALQGSTSSNCGQFCLYYSYFRARNFGMQCIVNSLTLDHAFNDYIVDHFVANYLN